MVLQRKVSKARGFYRFELWMLTVCFALFILAGLSTFFSYSAASGIVVVGILLYILARGVTILSRGVKYESKIRLLLLFGLLLGVVFLLIGVNALFATIALLGIDFILLFNLYRKTK